MRTGPGSQGEQHRSSIIVDVACGERHSHELCTSLHLLRKSKSQLRTKWLGSDDPSHPDCVDDTTLILDRLK